MSVPGHNLQRAGGKRNKEKSIAWYDMQSKPKGRISGIGGEVLQGMEPVLVKSGAFLYIAGSWSESNVNRFQHPSPVPVRFLM